MKQNAAGPHGGLAALARLLAAAASLLLAWLLISASVVELEVVELPLADLPATFDGLKILFVSDICVQTLNSPKRAGALLAKLAQSKPDVLILGGDYTVFDPLRRLGAADASEAYQREADARDQFFQYLVNFPATLGKFGVAGDNDRLLEERTGRTLESAMALGGVTYLSDALARLTRDGQTLTLAGMDDWTSGKQDIYSLPALVAREECAIAVTHNAEALPLSSAQVAKDGGAWLDAMLSGHWLGGQIAWESAGDGWGLEYGVKLLRSNGVGWNALPLRFNAPARAHLIILRSTGG